MSTWMGSIWRTVVSAVVWFSVTRAPGVTVDTSTRPEMGLSMVVRDRLMRAVSCAARATASSACDCLSAACASWCSCWLTASMAAKAACRWAVSLFASTTASALATLAWALA